MKKIGLLALVFITTFLNAQSVDPETFPLFSGDLKSKNLYTNTGGEGKVSIQSILDSVKIVDTISLNYNDFYTLITGGNLQVGKTYIIMDFQTVYDQMDFDNSGNLKPTLTTKTGAIEQIWVLALSSNQIADKAYSATYPKDEIQYDWTYNTTLVNGSPAKGRITERIDEWNNRTDYDHRVIKFIRYDDGSGNFTVINDNGNASQEFLTFGNNYANGGLVLNNYLGDFYSIGQLLGQEYSNNIFITSEAVSNLINGIFYNNTFNDNILKNTFSGEFRNNIINGSVFENSINGTISENLFVEISNSNLNGTISSSNIGGTIGWCQFNGSITNCLFQLHINKCNFSCFLSNCSFIYNTGLSNVSIFDNISSKTIDETIYPFLFNTQFKKEIFLASDNNIYARYFDGTNDINTLIP